MYLLQPGDSVMADSGFDIQDELALQGVRLNIPPFSKGKSKLSESELVETRIESMYIQWAMESIKQTMPSSMSKIMLASLIAHVMRQ